MNIFIPIWAFIMENAIYIQECIRSIVDYFEEVEEYETI